MINLNKEELLRKENNDTVNETYNAIMSCYYGGPQALNGNTTTLARHVNDSSNVTDITPLLEIIMMIVLCITMCFIL